MLIEERHSGDTELAALLDAALRELILKYGAYGRSQMKDGARYLVASVADQAVGCGALQPTDDPEVAELKRMYVVPYVRGKGVASAVLAALEAWAPELGYRSIRLATGVRQPEAIALYEKRGYGEITPYGKYADEPLTRCYGKVLAD